MGTKAGVLGRLDDGMLTFTYDAISQNSNRGRFRSRCHCKTSRLVIRWCARSFQGYYLTKAHGAVLPARLASRQATRRPTTHILKPFIQALEGRLRMNTSACGLLRASSCRYPRVEMRLGGATAFLLVERYE